MHPLLQVLAAFAVLILLLRCLWLEGRFKELRDQFRRMEVDLVEGAAEIVRLRDELAYQRRLSAKWWALLPPEVREPAARNGPCGTVNGKGT